MYSVEKDLHVQQAKFNLQYQEHKDRAKGLQNSLAMRIVKLEETLELINERNEERL